MSEQEQQVKICRAWAADLWVDGKYRAIVALIEQSRPIIPTYDYRTNNVEEMKFKSAQAHMHELIMRIIKPKEDQL